MEAQEFLYRLPRRASGQRPGSHPGSSLGTGNEFVAHASLYDRPDPRRLDLRASLANLQGQWLVRLHRQRIGTTLHVLADVSASMRFGAPHAKLDLVADFAEALALGAFRVGDTLGLLAFDARERLDLMLPATRSRAIGAFIAERLRGCSSGPGGIEGLEKAAMRLAGRPGLVFLASDFHWPLKRLGAVLDLLSPAFVVPLVVWDPAETEPPDQDAIATLSDAETGRRRTLWLNSRLRERWRDAVTQRRDELEALFKPRGLRPFYLSGRFNSEAMSRYFLEAAA